MSYNSTSGRDAVASYAKGPRDNPRETTPSRILPLREKRATLGRIRSPATSHALSPNGHQAAGDGCCNGLQIPKTALLKGLRILFHIKEGPSHSLGPVNALSIYLQEHNGIQVYTDPVSPITLSSTADQCKPIVITPTVDLERCLEMQVTLQKPRQDPSFTFEPGSSSGFSSTANDHRLALGSPPHNCNQARLKRALDDGDPRSDSYSDDDNSSDSCSDCGGDSDASSGVSTTAESQTEEMSPSCGIVECHGICSDDALGNLLHLASDRISSAKATAQYRAPPDDSTSLHQIEGTSLPFLLQGEAADDPEFVVIAHFKGYFHLACPYYRQYPLRFRDCLQHHSLQCIEDVIRHLRHHHKMAIYCPVCRDTFRATLDRDTHARRRKCQPNPSVQTYGLTERQLARLTKLTKRDKYHLGQHAQWMRIWAVVFLGVEPPSSPYLEQGVGLDVSIIRDFWTIKGEELISEFLGTYPPRNTQGTVGKSAAGHLYAWTLKRLICKALEKAYASDGRG